MKSATLKCAHLVRALRLVLETLQYSLRFRKISSLSKKSEKVRCYQMIISSSSPDGKTSSCRALG